MFYYGRIVGKRTYIFLLLLTALAAGPHSVLAQSSNSKPNPAPSNSDSIIRTRPSLSGGLENNNGQLRLNLTNNASREFRGAAVIGIGSDSEQKDIGQLALALPPQEITLLQFSDVHSSGNHFSLKIFDQNGALVFYKIAPVKTVSDSTPATVVTLSPVSKRGDLTVSSNKPPSPTSLAPAPNPGDTPPTIAEVTIKGRLLGGNAENDPFTVAFEMMATQPVYDATLAITLGKFNDRKPVSIKRDLTVEFKLPEEFDSERIGYELTGKNGRVIVKGELDLGQLMAEDSVTVTDIRTDKPSYDPGESVQITILLEGKSPHGFRLELQAKDGQGNIFFHNQYLNNADNQTSPQGLTLSLPREIASPVTLEFKIHDSATGLLFDSGEREIPLNNPKRRP